MPVTVTVCVVLQLSLVNVSDDGDTVPSVVSPLLTATVTSAVGGTTPPRATVNVAEPPASVIVPVTVPVRIPGVLSLSVTFTVRVTFVTPS